MHDPIRDLESFPTDGVTVNPLSPSEVRRRGDRLRRRHHAAAAVAGVAAIAVVAVPIAVFAGGADQRGQEPSYVGPSTTEPGLTRDAGEVSWRTDIPEGFPLAAGYPEANGDDGSPVTVAPDAVGARKLSMCGETFWAEGAEVDRLGARYRGEAEDSRGRTLLLLRDDRAATAVFDQAEQALAGCPEDRDRHFTSEGDALGVGDQRLVMTERYWMPDVRGYSTGLTTYVLARVGNAVLLATEYGEAGGSSETMQAAIDHAAAQASALVNEMCVFAEHPCVVETEPAPPAELDDGNLALARDLPPLEGMPWRQVEPQTVPTLACQGDWLTELGPWEVASREFRVSAASADDDLGMVNTAVLRFSDRDLADRAYETVLGWLETCPGSLAPARPTVNDEVAPVSIDLGPDAPAVDRAHRVLVAWQPPDFCPEGCDMAWFEHDVVAQVGDRLVFVSEAEAGGPCAPGNACPETEESLRPWQDRVDRITHLVVGRGVTDLR